MSCPGASWLLGGGWFWCRYGGFWMDSYSLIFCVVRSCMVFTSLGLNSPAPEFQCYSTHGSLQSDFDLIYCIFIFNWLCFISSRSLLNISCNFSIFVSRLFVTPFCFQDFGSFLLSLFEIFFSDRFPISSSFVWFGGHFSCSFTCLVFLCLFILFRLLCLGWAFCILLVCGSFLLWRFYPVGGVGRLACQGFLVWEACVNVLEHGNGFLLSGVQWSAQWWVLQWVYVLGVTLGSLYVDT